jgi:hypothetical protein
VVVVYKVDRLTRSLADFAKLDQLFDRTVCGLPPPLSHIPSSSGLLSSAPLRSEAGLSNWDYLGLFLFCAMIHR